jgi:hypothetical protein
MAFVQGTANGDTALASTIAAAFGGAVNPANFVVGYVACDQAGTPTISSITDDGGGTPTWAVKLTEYFGEAVFAVVGYGWTTTGPTNVIAHLSGSQADRAISLIEFSGQISGDPIDGSNFSKLASAPGGAGTVNANGSGGLTPSAANYLVWGGVVKCDDYSHGTSYFTPDSNFTKPLSAEFNVNNEIAIASMYWFQTTATITAAPWTVSVGGNYEAMMMVFKLSAAAPAVFKSWEAMPRPETIKQVLVPVVM